MATIHREIPLQRGAEDVWAALRAVDAVHTRLARGFVTDCRLAGDTRVVTFANGFVAKERIITIDDERRRLVYSVVDGSPTHHNGSFQVLSEGPDNSRLIWIADLLPDDVAGVIGQMMEAGSAAIKATLDAPQTTARSA
ncbi:SRPBCC family protein [Povalibacter sp.]|uniref:SRPBCC family protein n=1 Tax=Povalibacter sp. TaxID=1962978 RepID=UPI002F4080D6